MTVLAFAAIYLIWGSTFLAIRIAVAHLPPLLMMGARCIFAGSLLVGVGLARGSRPLPRHWAHAAVAGALMFSCAYGALAWAEERLASGIAALLVATLPFWLVTIESVHRREWPRTRTLVAIAMGLGGVALLMTGGHSGPLALAPAAAIVVGELAWAGGSLYARPPRLPAAITLAAGMPMLAGGVLLLAASGAVGEWRRVDAGALTAAAGAAVAYLVVFGSIVAFSAFQWLMRVVPASRVATHAYVNPLVAVALGAAVGGEPLTLSLVAAAAAIVLSVALLMTAPHRGCAAPRRAAGECAA